MEEELSLVCVGSNKRPIKTDAMRLQAAEKLVADLVRGSYLDDDDGAADQIVKVTRWGEYDGHKIARELDIRCGWDCDLELASELDAFGEILQDIFDEVEKKWAAENPHDPQFGEGEAVVWDGKEAKVAGIWEHRPQCYKVQTKDSKEGSFYVVPFEDVSAVSPGSAL